MNATKFLRKQSVIQGNATEFIIKFDDGREIILNELMEKYAQMAVDHCKGYRTDVEYVPGQSFDEFLKI